MTTSMREDLESLFDGVIPSDIPLNFYVAPDLSTAHLSTDVAYQIAKQNGGAPETIAEKIRRSLPSKEWVSIGVEGGWITIKILTDFSGSDFTESLKGKEALVLVPDLEPSVASKRIYASALLQVRLLQVFDANVRFIIGSEEMQPISLIENARRVLDRKNGKPSIKTLECVLDKAYEGIVTLWLAPDAFDPTTFKKFYSTRVANNPNINLKCPSSNWLYGYPEEPPSTHGISDEELYSILLLLAGEIPSKDLDLGASKFEEKENLYWLSTTLLSRLKQCSRGSVTSACSAIHEISQIFPLLSYDGARRGEILRLLGEYRRFLFSVLSWVGSPPRETQSHKYEERDIISGIMNVVSDMISLRG